MDRVQIETTVGDTQTNPVEIIIKLHLEGMDDREDVDEIVSEQVKEALDSLPIGDLVDRFGLEAANQLEQTLRAVGDLLDKGVPECFSGEGWLYRARLPLDRLHLRLVLSRGLDPSYRGLPVAPAPK